MNSPTIARMIVLIIDSPEIKVLVQRVLEPRGYTVVGMTKDEIARLDARQAGELARTLYAVIAYDIADVPAEFGDLIVIYSSGMSDAKFSRLRPLARPFAVQALLEALQGP